LHPYHRLFNVIILGKKKLRQELTWQ